MKTFRRIMLVSLSLASATTQSVAAPGDVDLSFDPGSRLNGIVFAITVQTDGKFLMGGGFTTVSGAARGGLARLNSNGSTDFTFMNGELGADRAPVYAVAVQSDRKIIVAGDFTSFNGVARAHIARLNPDGSLDTAFNASFAGEPYSTLSCLAIQNDGKILAGGFFTTVNGLVRTNLARLNQDGTLDQTFQSNVGEAGDYGIWALAIQTDGKILAGGNFSMVNGLAQTNLARLRQDGTLDSSFVVAVGDQSSAVRALALQGDGRILVGGQFASVDGAALEGIARMNTNGSLDASFTGSVPDGYNGVQAIEVQHDGRILIAGDFQTVNGTSRPYLARLNPDGTSDETFLAGMAGPDDETWSLALQTDGKILIGGQFESVNAAQRQDLTRLAPNGSLDLSFSNGAGGPDGYIEALAVQSDGRLIVGGLFTTFSGVVRHAFARLNTDGSLDGSFRDLVLPDYTILCVALQPDGKILIGGGYTMARLNPDGSLDGSFRAPLIGEPSVVRCLAVQPDGKILVGGTFSSIGGGTNRFLARLNTDGSVDRSFLSHMAGPDNAVSLLALQSDGKILIRGFFAFIDGVLRDGFARLNADGSLDTSFAYPPDGYAPENFAVQNDGKILIGVNLGLGGDNYGINRLNPDGTLDTSFLNGAVRINNPCQLSIALQSDGKIIIAGCFTTANGAPCGRIARLNANGSLDSSFSTGRAGADFEIYALALQGDTPVYIGGAFSTVNQVPRQYLARLLTANSPPVAGSPFIKVIADEVSEIPARRFLIWCSDPDNDPLTLSAVTSPSAMGALVTLQTNQVFYAPPAGFLGDDTFGYTITDGNGGFASGAASLLVEPRRFAAATMFPPITSPGTLQVNFIGFADLGYLVERAESLDGPWTPIGEVLTDDNGAASFTDRNPPSSTAFYRAVH